MSRKRKLYVSELLERNTNKKYYYTIVEDNTGIKFESKNDLLIQYKDKQVLEWYVSEYNGIVIFIK